MLALLIRRRPIPRSVCLSCANYSNSYKPLQHNELRWYQKFYQQFGATARGLHYDAAFPVHEIMYMYAGIGDNEQIYLSLERIGTLYVVRDILVKPL